MSDADGELVRRWRRGEEPAFAEMVRRWEQPLARFLGRLANADQVPDLLQETFMRVHRGRAHYSENGHSSASLFQIALNVARNASRFQSSLISRVPSAAKKPREST